ncbi:molybdopterin biosynthesis protein MoeB [Altererythrobacter indicus]|uniref:Molybdopterin biosynthesis protein MoeB n=1 Tax=Altericroceibacterium indicum TaxID=374177 RepID=A0A845ACA8_9SPHN|nr:HesA/MoeB/ThiF family protein [Altericroceibacterium indicum]MXP26631.1 molybdopterin biosynthesis protein MoeB [Altericroceibacterium indicum]
MDTLEPQRLNRFARHIILPEVGGAGQLALTKAHVVLVGVGGIGSPALQYLAGAGIGRLTLIDSDTVDESNLQRQTIFTPADIGQAKATAGAQWAAKFDPHLKVIPHVTRITGDNVQSLISGADLVLDGCDNFATRLAVSDACVEARVPLLSAALGRFQGQVGAFAGHLDGQPCYRCYVGDAFDGDDCDTCAQDGVLGAMVGWVGTFAAMQAIRILLKEISSFGGAQWGTLHLLDGMTPAMRSLTIAKDPNCRTCG